MEELGVDFTRIKTVMQADRYVVGFARPRPQGWMRYGLMQFVISHITEGSPWDEYTSGEVYSFEISVSTAHLYVRDHYYTSPR